MKRGKLEKLDGFVSLSRKRSVQILIGVGLLYMLLVTVEVPFVFRTGFSSISQEALIRPRRLDSEAELEEKEAPTRPLERVSVKANQPTQGRFADSKILSGLVFDAKTFDLRRKNGYSQLYESAKYAWEVGTKLWKDIQSGNVQIATKKPDNHSVTCPHSISLSGSEFSVRKGVMEIPCGLTLGSHVTLVGRPSTMHPESDPNDESLVASQFILELQGLKTVEGEAPPRVLHFNPRLKGDWGGKPVIELNTCYRMQWGQALRCEGWKSKADEETVDGQVKCEKWIRDDESRTEETKAIWWLKRLIGRTEKVTFEWPFPFTEGKLFVLTLSAGLEGYHVNVDGRHIASFPYRMGYTLEDATGLFIGGDISVKSLFAASLPSSHPSFSPQRYLEWLDKWRAPPLPDVNVELFIGILSAGNHFAERMAVRKSWMQHELIKSSTVVARFFVALHSKEEVNMELKKEAEFFGDIIIVPYMDNYDLVVLKTVAICEYGVRTIAAKSIMKCDDDTFVRVDAVLSEVQKVPRDKSFYVGNINYYHKPLRYGKWAVTYEEWPEENYPPYANGPGYILSFDIARFIASEFERHELRLFKMEDVSMGMWVEQFNSSKSVDYFHSLKYCQYGCVENYVTAHYQSPRQMLCLWDKLQKEGKPQCCNMR